MNNLGLRIQMIRKSMGYSQRKFAEMLGIAYQTQNKYEKGHRIPDVEYLQRLANITGCDPGWLLTGKNVQEAPREPDIPPEHRETVEMLLAVLERGDPETRGEIRGEIKAEYRRITKKDRAIKKGA